MINDALHVPLADFEKRTGWAIKPEGACKGEVCVPLGADTVADGLVSIDAIAPRLGMGVVHDVDAGLWAVGPETLGGRALATAEAPNFTLPDLDGNPFELSSLRGKKVLVLAWSPY